jgi:hypothetical protein
MARSLSTVSSSVLIALALALSNGAIACVADVDQEGEDGAELTGEDVCQQGATQTCIIENTDGAEGMQTCIFDEDGELAWSTCDWGAMSTPLVLSFESAPVTFAASAGAFDLTGTMSTVTDWPTSATPWLALDRNGNGAIDDGSELFGSASILNHGGRAENGFVALAELDGNGDGQITAADAAFSSLLVWSDKDGDRVSSAGELSSISAFRLVSIDLGYARAPRCDARGNCEIERASFRYADASGAERSGAVIDVHLKHQ